MIYVGIDVAKQGHFASLISSDGEILVGPFQFSNDGDGFQYLVSAFEPFESATLLRRATMFVSSIRSLLLPCEKITSAKRRQIRLILTSSPRLL